MVEEIPDTGVITVNTTDDIDDGNCDVSHCSLREAILAANSTTDTETIAFCIPGNGPHTIRPSSALPPITDAVQIDGYTQPGAAPNTNGTNNGSNAVLMIELDGSQAGSNVIGLSSAVGNNTIRGLVINRFSVSAITFDGQNASGNVIEGNFIGTDVSGTVALGNGSTSGNLDNNRAIHFNTQN